MKIILYVCIMTSLLIFYAVAFRGVCKQPPASDGIGKIRCRAHLPSWSYDKRTGQCIHFIYGGCGGNGNRFRTQAECYEKCTNSRKF